MEHTTTIELSAGLVVAGLLSVAFLALLTWWLLAWLGVLPRRRADG
jgi:hypothetical protein